MDVKNHVTGGVSEDGIGMGSSTIEQIYDCVGSGVSGFGLRGRDGVERGRKVKNRTHEYKY